MQERRSTQEEVGDKICIALRAARDLIDKPFAHLGTHRTAHLLATKERWVSDDGVESPSVDNDVGSFNDPMEWLPSLIVRHDSWRQTPAD